MSRDKTWSFFDWHSQDKNNNEIEEFIPPPSPLVTLCVIYAARRGMVDLIDAWIFYRVSSALV